jgi:hypothetical protein
MTNSLRSHELRPNNALKPTRLPGCLLRGHASVHKLSMQWLCTSPAGRLSASVMPL